MDLLPSLKKGAGLAALLVALASAPAHATNVAILYDPVFTPIGGGTGDEGSNLLASAEALGHTLTQIPGITEADFSAGLAGQSVLLIPDTEVSDLSAAITPEAEEVIAAFVNAGGRLVITNADDSGEDFTLLNQIFGFSLTGQSLGSEGSDKMAEADGTLFANAPTSLPYNDATSGINQISLPEGGIAIFLVPTLDVATVALIPVGEGEVIYLGWDWFDSDPPNDGLQDGGWQGVLGQALADADLAITKTVDDADVDTDETVTYTLTVANNGPNEAVGVSVEDDMPAGLTVVSVTPSQGTCDGVAPIDCDLGSLANGASATITVVATADTEGTFTNTATLTSLTIDANADNDEATASFTASTPANPDLSGGGCSLGGAAASSASLLPMAGLLLGLGALRRRKN